jgi:hypothetical protein
MAHSVYLYMQNEAAMPDVEQSSQRRIHALAVDSDPRCAGTLSLRPRQHPHSSPGLFPLVSDPCTAVRA